MGASGNSPQEDEDIALAGAALTPGSRTRRREIEDPGPAWFPEYDLRARTAGGGVQTIQPRTGDASQTTANQSAAAPARITWIGLFGALFGLVVIRDIVRLIAPDPSTLVVAVREAMILASAAGLLLVVRRLEGLPFTSIGLGTSRWWKSVLWGLLTSILCGGVAVALAKATGYGQGPASAAFRSSPLVADQCYRLSGGNRGGTFLPGLCHRAHASAGYAPLLRRSGLLGGVLARTLRGRPGKYPDRAGARRHSDCVLPLAARPGGEHSGPHPGGLRGKCLAQAYSQLGDPQPGGKPWTTLTRFDWQRLNYETLMTKGT